VRREHLRISEIAKYLLNSWQRSGFVLGQCVKAAIICTKTHCAVLFFTSTSGEQYSLSERSTTPAVSISLTHSYNAHFFCSFRNLDIRALF
jgi:hypothetical protein